MPISSKYKVVKEIEHGWQCGANVGDILTVENWGYFFIKDLTLMKDGLAVCDLNSECVTTCCIEIK